MLYPFSRSYSTLWFDNFQFESIHFYWKTCMTCLDKIIDSNNIRRRENTICGDRQLRPSSCSKEILYFLRFFFFFPLTFFSKNNVYLGNIYNKDLFSWFKIYMNHLSCIILILTNFLYCIIFTLIIPHIYSHQPPLLSYIVSVMIKTTRNVIL